MAFREAKCPNCGGELRVPDDKATVKCMYCSTDIIVRQAIQSAGGGANIDNLLTLARTAKDSGNNEEAYNYYTKILEVDPKHYEAWFGKGEAAGWTSTLRLFRLPEILTTFQKALEYAPPDKRAGLTIQVANTISSVAVAYYKLAKNQLIEYISNNNTWGEYLEQCSVAIQALERAYEYSPDDKQILENIVYMCKDNIEGVAYNDQYDTFEGMPTPKVARVSKEYETTLKNKIEVYENKIKQLDPSYQPITIKKATTGCFVATATMDDELHPFVITLKKFRDVWLSKRPNGRMFINYYYTYGYLLSMPIKRNKLLRFLSLVFIIHPAVVIAKFLIGKEDA